MQDPGAYVVSLTPFRADGSLDEAMLRAHFQRLADARIGVYVGGSGSGEGLTLTQDECFRLFRIAHEELSGRVPVRAMGIEPRTVAEMQQLARMADAAGLDAIQVYSIASPGSSSEEVEAYFADVLRNVRLPAVISTHHAVGYSIPVEVVGRIVAGFPNVIGINCTRTDIRLLDSVRGRAAVYVADLGYAYSNLALGGRGFLCGEANLVPRLCVRFVDAFRRGDHQEAAKIYAWILRIGDINQRIFGGVKGIKAALTELGLPGGHTRSPRLPPNESHASCIHDALGALDILSLEN